MRLAPPPLAPLHPGDDPLGVKLILPLGLRLPLGVRLDVEFLAAGIAVQLLAGAAEELAATLRGVQLLGQLIGHPCLASTTAGREPGQLARLEGHDETSSSRRGEVPQAATGRSPG
jgi:hypothetical protein